MQNSLMRAALAATFAVAFVLTGCEDSPKKAEAQSKEKMEKKAETKAEKKPEQKAEKKAEKKAGKDPVVAVVDGHEIKLSDLEAVKAMLPAQVQQMPTQLIFKPLLDQVIDTRLMSEGALNAGLDKKDRYVQSMALLRERLLRDEFITANVESQITDEKLMPLYEEWKKNQKPEPEINARHILVKEKKDAEAIIKQLAGGADFAKIAKEKSIGPSKVKGGDLGWFSKGQMVKAFDEAVFKLEKGKVSKEPVKTRFGWHVIKVEDVRMKDVPPFDKVKGKLAQELHTKLYKEAVEKLRADAKIVKFNMDGSEVKPKAEPKAEEKKKPEGGEKKEEKKE